MKKRTSDKPAVAERNGAPAATGGRERSRAPDQVTEAGIESFPASDPPSYSKRDEPPPGAGRKSLQEADLLEWMSGRLRQEPQYRACHFTAVERLNAADPEECNWLTAHLHCDAAPDKECMDRANEIIEEAKSRFNVADAGA